MTPPSNAGGEGREVLAREWRCFHCDEVFTSERCARLHFGRDEDSTPACLIKGGAEHGLLAALRDAENAAADAMRAVADECTDASRAYYAQMTRHNQALRNAEELGYERGIADGRELATRENADDRAPALVEAAVAEMRERAANVADVEERSGINAFREESTADMRAYRRGRAEAGQCIALAIRALPTPSQEASNVG